MEFVDGAPSTGDVLSHLSKPPLDTSSVPLNLTLLVQILLYVVQ